MTITSPTQRATIRSLVVATAIFGVLGLPTALLAGEPYPWIMMPGFASTSGYDGAYVKRQTATFVFQFADGTTRAVKPSTLFMAAPSSNYHTLTSAFAPDAADQRQVEDLATAPSDRGSTTHGESIATDDPELKAWFRGRADSLFPHRHAKVVDVIWQHVTTSPSGDDHVVGSQIVAQFEL